MDANFDRGQIFSYRKYHRIQIAVKKVRFFCQILLNYSNLKTEEVDFSIVSLIRQRSLELL